MIFFGVETRVRHVGEDADRILSEFIWPESSLRSSKDVAERNKCYRFSLTTNTPRVPRYLILILYAVCEFTITGLSTILNNNYK